MLTHICLFVLSYKSDKHILTFELESINKGFPVLCQTFENFMKSVHAGKSGFHTAYLTDIRICALLVTFSCYFCSFLAQKHMLKVCSLLRYCIK